MDCLLVRHVTSKNEGGSCRTGVSSRSALKIEKDLLRVLPNDFENESIMPMSNADEKTSLRHSDLPWGQILVPVGTAVAGCGRISITR